VKFLCYEATMQTACLRLMGKKLLVALTMEGKFAGEGLQSIDEDDDMLSAMARELIERNVIGKSADSVWKALSAEHQKLFPGTPVSMNDTVSLEPSQFAHESSQSCRTGPRGNRSGLDLDFWTITGSLSGRKTRGKRPVPEQALLFG
jgi:hypothetical protein